ncbi:hypothetical protein OH76DRAFT_1396149 [Lentinus brumalis]|uniref:Uncharacterized protein n=1 Tax=Lentinus brumalis TaxID=2498619 RepID=A0A371DTH2_9APHY|nr:hypothetical protein OH76DRAFT_1396149 [Polyporus brumalis]
MAAPGILPATTPRAPPACRLLRARHAAPRIQRVPLLSFSTPSGNIPASSYVQVPLARPVCPLPPSPPSPASCPRLV